MTVVDRFGFLHRAILSDRVNNLTMPLAELCAQRPKPVTWRQTRPRDDAKRDCRNAAYTSIAWHFYRLVTNYLPMPSAESP